MSHATDANVNSAIKRLFEKLNEFNVRLSKLEESAAPAKDCWDRGVFREQVKKRLRDVNYTANWELCANAVDIIEGLEEEVAKLKMDLFNAKVSSNISGALQG
jgi:hypothetical protein